MTKFFRCVILYNYYVTNHKKEAEICLTLIKLGQEMNMSENRDRITQWILFIVRSAPKEDFFPILAINFYLVYMGF